MGRITETYKLLAKKHGATIGQIKDLLKDRTFDSERKKEIQENCKKVVKAYYSLNDEQKKKPLAHIRKVIPLAASAIRNHLINAKLYQASGMHGKSTINILTENTNQHKENKGSKKRKIEDDSNQEQHKPAKRKKINY